MRNSFGGAGRFIASAVTETIFFLMLSPIMWFGHTVFLTGLRARRTIGWGGQARDDHAVPWSDAARQLWPHTLLGWGCILILAFTVPSAIPYALFIAGGTRAVDPARRHHVVAARRPGADARRHRRAAGGERAALRRCASSRCRRSRRRRCGRADVRRRAHARGIDRSLRIYYGDQRDTAAMDALYARFVKAGDLVFDIGSHVGDRIAAFRRLGRRVVACEPNPSLVPTLRLLYGRDADGDASSRSRSARKAGEIELKINVDNPTVSTASSGFRARRPAARRAGKASTGTRASRCR